MNGFLVVAQMENNLSIEVSLFATEDEALTFIANHDDLPSSNRGRRPLGKLCRWDITEFKNSIIKQRTCWEPDDPALKSLRQKSSNYCYRFFNASWGIVIHVGGTIKQTPEIPPLAQEVYNDIWLLPFPREITSAETAAIKKGIGLMASSVPKPLLIKIDELEWNYCDYQDVGLVPATAEWIAHSLDLRKPENVISYDKITKRYVLNDH